jgi:uncharacterized phage protein (predicted DNA packaging)
MLDLTSVKRHLRIDHTSEDDLITGLMAAATDVTANYIGVAALDSTAPASVKLAAMMLVNSLYENREGVGRPRNTGMFERLLESHRVMV